MRLGIVGVGFIAASVVTVATATSAQAASDAIGWSVVNNFGLLSGAETQKRFRAESDAYIACMRKQYSPGSCANGRTTFGLTQQAYQVRFQPKALTYDPHILHPTAPESGDAANHVTIELSVANAGTAARCHLIVGVPPQNGKVAPRADEFVSDRHKISVSHANAANLSLVPRLTVRARRKAKSALWRTGWYHFDRQRVDAAFEFGV